jgi:glycosyltransferase involved in cell wall biosynthesis
MIRWADVVHLTGVYSHPTIPTLLLCSYDRKPLMWSPRGSLQDWKHGRKKLLKSVYATLARTAFNADLTLLDCTSREEADESMRRFKQLHSVVIPHGIDGIPEPIERYRMPSGILRILFMGRLHRIKGIENLLEAIRSVQIPVRLSICGDGEKDYRESLYRSAEDLVGKGLVEFAGHLEGSEWSSAFNSNDVCIVPSYTENFGMTVLEALAHGVPVIAGKGTPWSGLPDRGCGMWVDNDPDSLASAITEIAAMDLRDMGERGRQWVKEEFLWSRIASSMADAYRELLDRGAGRRS